MSDVEKNQGGAGPHELISQLLTYIERVEMLGRKPPYAIDAAALLGYQDDIEGLPGVSMGSGQEGEAWLEVARLAKMPPPGLPAGLEGKAEVSDAPSDRPVLAERGGADEAARAEMAAYLAESWEPWAAEEARRRAGIKLYQRLFALHQTMAMDAADSPMELLWGIGMSSWRAEGKKQRVMHPLITQACVIELGKEDFAIRVRPAPAVAVLEIDCYADMEIAGAKRLEAQWRGFCESMVEDLSPFVAETFAPMLSMAARVLCDAGRCELGARFAPEPGPCLVVTGSWSLHARRRASHFLLRDVERLRESAKRMERDGVELPGFASAFVERGSDQARDKPRQSYRGMSSGSELAGAADLCFPLPYNQEQVRIIQELERSSGVVVQGPPGTGKTHTIANVVSHYLAQGKKVLVTAKGETALSVIKQKLPEDIGRLCVALLSDEADGMRQFELSVSAIAGEVAQIDTRSQEELAERLAGRIDEVHAAIAMLDRQAGQAARLRMDEHEFQGGRLSTGEIARALAKSAGAMDWMLHGRGAAGGRPSAKAVDGARRARLDLGADVERASGRIGPMEDVPTAREALGARAARLRLGSIQRLREAGEVWPFKPLEMGVAVGLGKRIDAAMAVAVERRAELDRAGEAGWATKFERALDREWEAGAAGPARALEDWAAKAGPLEARRSALVADAVELPAGAEQSAEFLDEARRRAEGGSGGLMGMWRNKEGRRLCDLARVSGAAPSTPKQWGKALAAARLGAEAQALLASLRACGAEFGMPVGKGGEPMAALREARPELDRARAVSGMGAALREARAAADLLFEGPWRAEASAEGARAMGAQIALGVEELLCAREERRWGARRAGWASWSGPVAERLDGLSDRLGDPGADEGGLGLAWEEARAVAGRLSEKRASVEALGRAAQEIAAAGAPEWARGLGSEPAREGERAIDGEDWEAAWEWRAWMNELGGALGQGDAMAALSRRRAREDELAGLYEELAVARAWLGVKRGCVPSVAQKLRQYLGAVRSMGKGTGVRAERHRKTAREAMGEAYKAIPCWIMPHWRVSESMLSEIGVFDLVIVDEASQSDIWALPALLRGKKILVVGDHKQVSPTAVGVAEEDIRELGARFLAGQPHGSEMTPDKSIYDLASVVFADSSVMLREHFRCDPAIIEFSNKNFYGGQIKPLRAPTRREAVGAPLVDVLVKDGFRVGDKNPAEARAIVDMAKALCADPAFAGKSIGVVTLLGSEQAALIGKMVAEEIGPSEIVGRQLAVGVPSMFQGRERDVMLVSMVLSAGNRGWADKLDMEQRLNVALSRARDKVFLFRSVGASDMGASSLAGKLIAHFDAPFAVDPADSARWRALCESEFEREMFDAITAMGHKARPQFPCGGYRIDFVVEGADGSRLAVECDGDRYHGPERWADDMARQRVLERAGWAFWRCFASDFALDRRAALESLSLALAARGVRPGEAARADHALVERIEVVALAGKGPERPTAGAGRGSERGRG